MHTTGEKTSVHKPLLSAGDVTDKGHALWLDGDVGYIIQKDPPILTAMRTCFEKACLQHSWNGAIDLTKERGVYNLYVKVAGAMATWSELSMSVPMKWRLKLREVVHRGASSSKPVRLRSDGGEEAVAPRVPPVPSKPTQAEQDEHHATGHAANRSWCEHCVRGRGRVSPYVSVLEGELPEVGVDYAYVGPEGSQVKILCVQMQTYWMPGSDTGAREGHEC